MSSKLALPPLGTGVSIQQEFRWQSIVIGWLMSYDSINTRSNYLRALKQFRQVLPDTNLWDVTTIQCEGFRAWLEGQGFAPSTRQQRESAIWSLYNHALTKHGDQITLEENPMDRAGRTSVPLYGRSESVDVQEVADILASIDTSTHTGRRDFALFSTMIIMARRTDPFTTRNGTPAYRIRDYDGKYLRGTYKGSKTQKVELPDEVRLAIDTYLKNDRANAKANEALFANVYDTTSPLSHTQIRNRWKAYGGHGGLHKNRSAGAVLASMSGANPREIQELLGHKNLQTTIVYLQSLGAGDTGKTAQGVAAQLARLQKK